MGSAARRRDRASSSEYPRPTMPNVGVPTTADGLRVPPVLDLPDSGRQLTAAEMGRKLRVLFVVSQPTSSPAISVHADLMRFLNPDRVEVHVVYNRLADAEPYRSDGSSVLNALPRAGV